MCREERIDQELKRLKAVQEVAQYRAEAQASRRLLEHQKSVARVSVPTPHSGQTGFTLQMHGAQVLHQHICQLPGSC